VSDGPRLLRRKTSSSYILLSAELASIPFDSLLKAQKQLSKSTAHASRKSKGKGKQVDNEEAEEADEGSTRKGKKNQTKDKKGRGKGGPEGRSSKHA